MVVMLTDRSVAAVKPKDVQIDLWDEKITGLGVRVSRAGTKAWTLRYRMGSRLRRWTIGRYPTLSLADARKRARNALRDVEDGIDPALEKKERRDPGTFGQLADEYLKAAQMKKRTWKDDRRRLATHARPLWKHRLARNITRRDVRELLESIAPNAPIEANRTRALLHTLFRFGVSRDIVESNPVADLERPAPEQSRDRVLTEAEIRTLWGELDTLEPAVAAFFKLRLLTAQRGGEVSSMRWQDVDLETGWWTIPAERSKNKLPHRVPLTPSVVKILKALKPKTDRQPVFVLEGARGKRQQAEAATTFTISDFKGHDLRRTAASFMASGGVQRLVISKVLNHVERSITADYDRHRCDAEKHAALSWWDTRLTAIFEQTPGKVRAFRRGGVA